MITEPKPIFQQDLIDEQLRHTPEKKRIDNAYKGVIFISDNPNNYCPACGEQSLYFKSNSDKGFCLMCCQSVIIGEAPETPKEQWQMVKCLDCGKVITKSSFTLISKRTGKVETFCREICANNYYGK
jgi:ribosomal protein S27E